MNPIEEYVKKMQEEYSSDLERTALDYLKIGLELFHQRRYLDYPNSQVALGNLAIAIELMLKTFIARKNLFLLFNGLPPELNVLFICPQSLEPEFNLRPYGINLKTGLYKTLEFNECVSYFYIFFPKLKQSYHSHLRLLSSIRNASVHAVFPSFQRYDIERVAFIALQFFMKLQEGTQYQFYALTENDKTFLMNFKEERINTVRTKIEQAKETSKKIKDNSHDQYIDDDDEDYWEQYIAECPICGSDALLGGYTESQYDLSIPEEWLEFYPDTFLCDGCDLELNDDEELRLAGIDTVYDRTDDLERWHHEKDDDTYFNKYA